MKTFFFCNITKSSRIKWTVLVHGQWVEVTFHFLASVYNAKASVVSIFVSTLFFECEVVTDGWLCFAEWANVKNFSSTNIFIFLPVVLMQLRLLALCLLNWICGETWLTKCWIINSVKETILRAIRLTNVKQNFLCFSVIIYLSFNSFGNDFSTKSFLPYINLLVIWTPK